MSTAFDPKELRGAYDRGRLVPFLGSGMSIPTCTNWTEFVQRLEYRAGIRQHADQQGATRLMERAATAMHALRLRDGASLTNAIREAVYMRSDPQITDSTKALSQIYWPLVCTTNYDELYASGLRAALRDCQSGRRPAREQRSSRAQRSALPGDSMRLEVLGRSEADCRIVLQQLAFPTKRVLWALQGFLRPTEPMPDLIEDEDRLFRLEQELVVGHAEYRRAAHRTPHFRRVFAEVFRSRSFLFVGAGLSEPYFRALFDEIIELTGAPVRPHYAFVREGAVDPDFMKREYHIICYCYPPKEHFRITKWIDSFRTYLGSNRVRLAGWSYDVGAPYKANAAPLQASFRVVRSALIQIDQIEKGEAIAISCGRDRGGANGEEPAKPVPGSAGARALKLGEDRSHVWHGPWIVQWNRCDNAFGIVARESGDERTPRAIREAFYEFLKHAHEQGIHKVHMQLLAAGKQRQFAPWVSLAQMARAYGDWARQFGTKRPPVEATVYVVDPGVLSLLQGGFLDVSEELDGGHLRISVDSIEADGSSSRYFELVSADAKLSTLPELRRCSHSALLSCTPKARYEATPVPYGTVTNLTFRDFGLVSGSTLHIDCRTRSPAGTDEKALVFDVLRAEAAQNAGSKFSSMSAIGT